MTSQCNENWQNKLYTGDNLYILHGMNSESVDLIYLDPPFNSNRNYFAPIGSKAAGVSFKDVWTWQDVNEYYLERLIESHPGLVRFIESISETHSKAMMAYITYMTERVLECYRILKDSGSLYFHCDPTASHYIKIMLDEIFGRKNFRNEIVWSYSTGGISQKHYARKHDIIFFYSKNLNQYCFTLPKIESKDPLRFNLQDKYGKMYYEKAGNKYYLEDGVALRDVWDINPIRNTSKERIGYPTQKPLALLDRIIKASSKKGDIVLDPFCGCATTCVAAQQLCRRWIGIDIEEKAVDIVSDRLRDSEGGEWFSSFINPRIPPKRTDVVELLITAETKNDIKKQLFKEQEGICKGCQKEFDIFNFDIDHIVPKSKGGGDYIENYQLLCGNCNSIKGNRPMDYLRMKIEEREKLLKNRIRFGE